MNWLKLFVLVRLANGLSSHITDVIDRHLASVFDSTDAEKYNKDFLENNSDSLPHIYAGNSSLNFVIEEFYDMMDMIVLVLKRER